MNELSDNAVAYIVLVIVFMPFILAGVGQYLAHRELTKEP